MTSLVGHSGSGKSTILNLIPRFYDAQSGDITIDGNSIYKHTIRSLRKEISMVSQETTLFDDTIKNNIRYANENASDEEIYEVSKLSFCEDFINNLPDKYETLIGENGVRLSGGEKQRLSIARAMLKKSSIILLETTTSLRVLELQAMCSGLACTSGTSWVSPVVAAAPQIPLSNGITKHPCPP